jgi:hypothetical protein
LWTDSHGVLVCCERNGLSGSNALIVVCISQGMVLSAEKDMALMLPTITRAIPSIFGTHDSMFLTAPVKDILFEGILVNCTLKDFTAKVLCTLMKTQGKDLQKVGKNAFRFSLFGAVSTRIFWLLLGCDCDKNASSL